jgi:hypothetical protein
MHQISSTGDHTFVCAQAGKGGICGRKTSHHEAVKYRVIALLKKYSKGRTITNEPSLQWPLKPGVNRTQNTKTKGDIAIEQNGVSTILDVQVTFPNVARHPRASSQAGAALEAGKVKKNTEYKDYAIPVGRFVPFIMETGGRMHKDAREFLNNYIKLYVSEEPNMDLWTPEEKTLYSQSISHCLSSISVALTTSIATTFIRYDQSIRAEM